MAAAPPSPTTAAAIAAAAGAAGHGHHAPLIPSYPYNLSMSSPFIPGCSSSDPRLFEQHAPDDSSVQTRLPSIAVDYLSHDWKEDDVWASWKAMTKHKSELANGVRLENASWRTWAKQRGKLKTISPETLNWWVTVHSLSPLSSTNRVSFPLTGSKTPTLRGFMDPSTQL